MMCDLKELVNREPERNNAIVARDMRPSSVSDQVKSSPTGLLEARD